MPPTSRISESPSRAPERLTWTEVEELVYLEHRQGQHIAAVGPTGSGKTVLLTSVVKTLGRRKAKDGRPARVTALGTKPRDVSLEQLGWPIITKWPPGYGQEHVIVWPRSGDPETAPQRQRAVFRPLLRRIYEEGHQTVYIDELAYFEEPQPEGLGLRQILGQYWYMARASKLTLVAGTQRPRRVSRSMWSESDWLFVFRLEDGDDLRRLREIGAGSGDIREHVTGLDEHEFLLIRRVGPGGELYISKVET